MGANTSIPSKPIILIGAGGHAKVLLDLLDALGLFASGVVDPALKKTRATIWRGIPILGDDQDLALIAADSVLLINGVGSLPGQDIRAPLFKSYKEQGFKFLTLIHPFSFVGANATLGEGVQIMAGSVVQADCQIQADVVINTMSSIDHDCVIGAHTHVAPGAVISGGVIIGSGCHIGVGASIIQNIKLGDRAVVGAGSVVIADVPYNSVLTGQPPMPVRQRRGCK